MANLSNSLAAVMQLGGAVGVAIVDLESGMSLGQAGGGSLNLEIAAAGNTEVVRAKMRTMADLGLSDEIEDILITLGTQYHIIRPAQGQGFRGAVHLRGAGEEQGEPCDVAPQAQRDRIHAHHLVLGNHQPRRDFARRGFLVYCA
jgi:hypothetical protein